MSRRGAGGLALGLLAACGSGPQKEAPGAGLPPGPGCVAVAWLQSDPERCFGDVQDAVDAAADGDLLTLLPPALRAPPGGPAGLVIDRDLQLDGGGGRWEGDGTAPLITVRGGTVTVRDLQLAGGGGGTDPDFADGTETLGGAINALWADGLVLADVELRDSRADWGAGLFGPVAGPLHMERVVVADNSAAMLGGGVWMQSGTLREVEIRGNDARYAGGLALRAVGEGGAQVTATALVIEDNWALVKGGGLHIAGDTTLVGDAVTLRGNGAQQGAGLHLYQATGAVSGLWIGENIAQVGGGGAMVDEGQPVLAASVLVDNVVTGAGLPDEEGVGGGLWVADAAPTLEDLELEGNVAGWGAGLRVAATPGLAPEAPTRLAGVALTDCGPAGDQRGAALAVEGGWVEGTGLTLAGGSGREAGGLRVASGTVGIAGVWRDNTPADVWSPAGGTLAAVPAGTGVRCDDAGCRLEASAAPPGAIGGRPAAPGACSRADRCDGQGADLGASSP